MDIIDHEKLKRHIFSISIALLFFITILAVLSPRTLGMWEGIIWPVQKLTKVNTSLATENDLRKYLVSSNGIQDRHLGNRHILIETTVEKIRGGCDYLGNTVFIVDKKGNRTRADSNRISEPAILLPGETVDSIELVHVSWNDFVKGKIDILYEKNYACHPFWNTITPQIITYNLTTDSK